jgi:ABC-type amino acid transport substrate-binding protein
VEIAGLVEYHPRMASQLNQVICAAIAEWQGVADAYGDVYRYYLRVSPPVEFGSCSGGTWIDARRVIPGSSLDRVLKRGVLRIGHIDAAPYVFRTSASTLAGLDYENGRAIAALMAKNYTGFSAEPEWVLVGGTYPSETAKSLALQTALSDGEFDVALSGLANVDPEVSGVEWLCATNQCFSNFTYTGRDNLPVGKPQTRDDVVKMLKGFTGITIAYVSNNPGPSAGAAADLARDVGTSVTLVPSGSGGPDIVNDWIANQTMHFALGDGIAQSWLAINQWPRATNFNVQVALSGHAPQQVAGFTLQGP